MVKSSPMGSNQASSPTCQACGRTGEREGFKLIIHQRMVLNEARDEILGVEKQAETDCLDCLAWLDMNVMFYLHCCEKGMEN